MDMENISKNIKTYKEGIETFVKKNPIESVLIAFCGGYCIGSMITSIKQAFHKNK